MKHENTHCAVTYTPLMRGRSSSFPNLVVKLSTFYSTWTFLLTLYLIENVANFLFHPNLHGKLLFIRKTLTTTCHLYSLIQDYDGQRKAEKYFQIIILAFAAIGLATGFVFELFSYTVYILLAGFFISALVS